jgi:hemin uptake protein HemP
MLDPSHVSREEGPDPVLNPGAERVVDSERILGAASSVWIRHRGVLYRLMKTKQGKLILTK